MNNHQKTIESAATAMAFVESLKLPATPTGDARAHALIQSITAAIAIRDGFDALAASVSNNAGEIKKLADAITDGGEADVSSFA